MATEVRMYRLKPGRSDAFIELFTSKVMPTAARYGVRIHAAWLDRANNELIWIRSYDSRADVEAYESSPERIGYIPDARSCIESADIREVEPVLGDLPVANGPVANDTT